MINRRRFIACCGGLGASFIAAGHNVQFPAAIKANQSDSSGRQVPRELADDNIGKMDFLSPGSTSHSDLFVLDNIAQHGPHNTPHLPQEALPGNFNKASTNSVIERLEKLQNYVGYGNFNIVGWDKCLRIARSMNQVGSFTNTELEFIEELFFTNAVELGFNGDKISTQLSDTIKKQDIVKIAGSGHYLFKGAATDTYNKIIKDVGDTIILTSGVRNIVKQIYLFLNKTVRVNGNMSLASNSVAPPGYSYHAVGDFDIGKKGFGKSNFSIEFASTDEFKRLSDLGYLDIRYPQNNPSGVRYEPWHVKVVS
jgi:D-alanyl-D-alanine carboxypeptidase